MNDRKKIIHTYIGEGGVRGDMGGPNGNGKKSTMKNLKKFFKL